MDEIIKFYNDHSTVINALAGIIVPVIVGIIVNAYVVPNIKRKREAKATRSKRSNSLTLISKNILTESIFP
jgi:hypothetical protein